MTARRRWVLLALVAVFVGLSGLVVFREGASRAVDRDWPVNVAHRGASAYAPENTLEAYREALELGAGGLELDVHLTRDGRLVVIHDDTVDRTTDGSGPVRDKTLAELQALDAGYDFTTDGGQTYRFRGTGVRVPTLDEVYKEFPSATLNIEIKESQTGIEKALLGVIDRAGAADRTIVVSTGTPVIDRFREVSGGRVRTAASRREITVFYLASRLRLERLVRPPYDALQVPPSHENTRLVTRRFVEAAHDRGVRVDVWTINESAEMNRLLDLGVDSVMTDRPDVLQEVLQSRRTAFR